MKAHSNQQNEPSQGSSSSAFQTVMPPVHRASTVFFDDVNHLHRADWREREPYSYGREATPTTTALEKRLAEIEGGRHVILAPSGLAAFTIVSLGLLESGDRVALPENSYGTGAQMVEVLLRRLGIAVSVYEPTEPTSWDTSIPSGTRLVWIEAPGSITMEVPDLSALMRHAKSIGAYTAIDNTYSAGLHFKPFELGIDVSIQALTKFQSGGGDVVMGSLSCVDDELHARLKETRHYLGMAVSSDDAYLVLRGLQTINLRYNQSSRSGETVASWFQDRPGVERVMYPPFIKSVGSTHWRAHFSAAAGLFSVALPETTDVARLSAFVDALQTFRIGYSWGGPVSLVMPYGITHPSVQRLRKLGHPVGGIVRFWVGLEDPKALINDIETAWAIAMV